MVLSWMIAAIMKFAGTYYYESPDKYSKRYYEYKQVYQTYCQDHPRIRIVVEHLPDNTVGYCSYGSGENLIELDADYWGEAPEYEKEQLVFHEMGHCDLYRKVHTEGVVNMFNGALIPKSIMKSEGMIELDYKVYHDYYMKELFQDL